MTRAKWFPHPIVSAALLLLWLVLNSTIAFGHVLLGMLLGWSIPWVTKALWAKQLRLHQPVVALRLLGVVLYDIVIANLTVARLIIGPVAALRPAFVRVPLDVSEPFAIWTLASIITLTPGTVSAELSADRRTLLVHALDLDDAAALVAEIKQRYEAPLKEIFE